jgi:CAAX protease family protein
VGTVPGWAASCDVESQFSTDGGTPMKSRVVQSDTDRPEGRGAAHHVVADPKPAGSRPGRGRSGGIRGLIRRHPVSAFFVLAFALTWFTVPLGSFMAAGPLLAALIVLGITEGRPGLRDLWRRMIQWRVGWRWYVPALLVPLGVAFAAGGLNVVFGASDGAFARMELSSIAVLFGLRLVVPVFAPVGEEPGWRGFALPRLQAGHSPFVATLILGVVVAAWHVPLLTLSSEHFEPIMLLGTVAVTFFYTWLFNHSDGSVFLTIVAHAADGLVGHELTGDHGWGGANQARFAVLYSLGWVVVAVVLLVADRKMWRRRPAGADVIDVRDGSREREVYARR